MSQTYRVKAKARWKEVLKSSRRIVRRLNVLPILERQAMGELIGVELEKTGWLRQDGKFQTEKYEIQASFDPLTLEISLKAETEQAFEESFEGELDVYDEKYNEEMALKNADEEALKELKNQANRQKTEMDLALDEKLAQAPLQKLLDSDFQPAVNKAHVEALKQKASSLGEIETIEENQDELTIRIRV